MTAFNHMDFTFQPWPGMAAHPPAARSPAQHMPLEPPLQHPQRDSAAAQEREGPRRRCRYGSGHRRHRWRCVREGGRGDARAGRRWPLATQHSEFRREMVRLKCDSLRIELAKMGTRACSRPGLVQYGSLRQISTWAEPPIEKMSGAYITSFGCACNWGYRRPRGGAGPGRKLTPDDYHCKSACQEDKGGSGGRVMSVGGGRLRQEWATARLVAAAAAAAVVVGIWPGAPAALDHRGGGGSGSSRLRWR